MAKSPNIKLEIPAPCHESWDSMTPNEKGRYCTNCNKTVIDFSAYSDKELLEFFNKIKGNICGRLNEFQINRPIAIPVKNHSFSQRIFFGIALATGSALTAQSQVVNQQATPVHVPVPTPPLNIRIEKSDTIQTKQVAHTDTSKYIKGIVLDSANNQPLPFAIVFINGTSIGTQTDMQGNFTLEIPELLRGQNVSLQIKYLGYHDKVVTITPTADGGPTTIPIQIRTDLTAMPLGGCVVVTRYSRAETFWHKITHPFRKRYSAE